MPDGGIVRISAENLFIDEDIKNQASVNYIKKFVIKLSL